MTDVEERVSELVQRAESSVEHLEEHFGGVDEVADRLEGRAADEDWVEEGVTYLRDLWEVADEAEDLLEAVDLTDLPESIDVDEIPEAVEAEDVPDAIRELDATEAVKLRKLLEVIDLRELWDATDIRQLWKEKQEFDDELEDVTGEDDESDGLVDVDASADDFGDALGGGELPDESYEAAIQSKTMEGVEGFRESLLEVHDKLKNLRQENEDRAERRDRETSSRNPTAVSLIPKSRNDMGGVGHFSTVPRETRYSSAPNKKRIYGSRFEERDDDA